VDWGHLGSLELDSIERQLWGFTFTLGYSRMMMAEAGAYVMTRTIWWMTWGGHTGKGAWSGA